jgi:hypothetical protein
MTHVLYDFVRKNISHGNKNIDAVYRIAHKARN